MGFKSSDNLQDAIKTAPEHDIFATARQTIYDSEGTDFFKSHRNSGATDISLNSLPKIDLTGFDQEAPDHSTGLTKVWHSIEHLFSKRETIGDQVREKVVDEMKHSNNPAEKENYKKYQEEEKALQHYHDQVRQWETQMTLNSGKMPEPPDCPMHDEVARRARGEEAAIIKEVRSHMTPQQQRQVDADEAKYLKDLEESHRIKNPIGTGEGFGPRPEPSEALKTYWRHIQEATDLHTGR